MPIPLTSLTRLLFPVRLAISAVLPLSSAAAEMPATIAAPGEAPVARLHAQGAQIYECKPTSSGELAWHFREPVASLFDGNRTVGRHYAGPKWRLADGSEVEARVAGRAAGATPMDIPLLKLEVTTGRHTGLLADVATIQRLSTRGGVAEGPCPSAGELLSVPYSADYVFLKRKH